MNRISGCLVSMDSVYMEEDDWGGYCQNAIKMIINFSEYAISTGCVGDFYQLRGGEFSINNNNIWTSYLFRAGKIACIAYSIFIVPNIAITVITGCLLVKIAHRCYIVYLELNSKLAQSQKERDDIQQELQRVQLETSLIADRAPEDLTATQNELRQLQWQLGITRGEIAKANADRLMMEEHIKIASKHLAIIVAMTQQQFNILSHQIKDRLNVRTLGVEDLISAPDTKMITVPNLATTVISLKGLCCIKLGQSPLSSHFSNPFTATTEAVAFQGLFKAFHLRTLSKLQALHLAKIFYTDGSYRIAHPEKPHESIFLNRFFPGLIFEYEENLKTVENIVKKMMQHMVDLWNTLSIPPSFRHPTTQQLYFTEPWAPGPLRRGIKEQTAIPWQPGTLLIDDKSMDEAPQIRLFTTVPNPDEPENFNLHMEINGILQKYTLETNQEFIKSLTSGTNMIYRKYDPRTNELSFFFYFYQDNGCERWVFTIQAATKCADNLSEMWTGWNPASLVTDENAVNIFQALNTKSAGLPSLRSPEFSPRPLITPTPTPQL